MGRIGGQVLSGMWSA